MARSQTPDHRRVPLNSGDIRHLFRRVGFGALDSDIAAHVGRARAEVVDAILTAPGTVDPATSPDVAGMTRFEARQVLASWWVTEMATSPAPVIERLTLFWHSHFACSTNKVTKVSLLRDQHVTFRRLGAGPFLDLVQAIAVSPATLIELDNAKNIAGHEQENFARELMELYTLGNGNFAESDVIDMARAWTGHGLSATSQTAAYEFHPAHHDDGPKTLFGLPPRNWNGPDVIDEIVTRSGRAATFHHLSTKLWQQFGDPEFVPAAAVDAIAAAWSAPGGTTIDALRTLLMRDEFWAPERRFAMVKAPIPWLAEIQRRTGAAFSPKALDGRSGEMGQRLFEPPSVNGWGHNDFWTTPSRLLARAHVAKLGRFTIRDSGFLAGMESLDDAAAADFVLAKFGVPDAASSTRAGLISFLTSARADLSRAAVAGETVRLAATLPEVNLA